jgi:hypothetical protein
VRAIEWFNAYSADVAWLSLPLPMEMLLFESAIPKRSHRLFDFLPALIES